MRIDYDSETCVGTGQLESLRSKLVGTQGVGRLSLVSQGRHKQLRWLKRLVGERGFEPPTPWSRTRCSTRLSHAPTTSVPFSWCPATRATHRARPAARTGTRRICGGPTCRRTAAARLRGAAAAVRRRVSRGGPAPPPD